MEDTPQVKLGKLLQLMETQGVNQDKILNGELSSRIHEFTRAYTVELREHHKKYCA